MRLQSAAAAPAGRGRITSLDWVRGWFLVANVATVSVLSPRPEQLIHADWIGLTVQDMIFPLFVTLSGCGLAFAHRNQIRWGPTLRRSIVLLLCGLVYTMAVTGSWDISTLRLTGPLQIYAVIVLIVGLLHGVAHTARAWALVTAIVAAAQTALLLVWQAGCDGGLTPECNPSATIDTALLGVAHMYRGGTAGHDPEGLVAILGALVTTCVGTTAGHLALEARRTGTGPRRLTTWAGIVAVIALATFAFLPVMKRLWTTPFALGVAAIGVLLFAIGIVLLDSPARGTWARIRTPLAWPLTALGRNSLLVYFGSHLLMIVVFTRGDSPNLGQQIAQAVDVVGHPRASFVIAMVLAWTAVAAILHKLGIYVRPK